VFKSDAFQTFYFVSAPLKDLLLTPDVYRHRLNRDLNQKYHLISTIIDVSMSYWTVC
jgi:lipopolysaccharide assembly outer membrane protein LptD (OstA)